MITSLQEWTFYLRDMSAGIALPLIASGAGLMLFGWRLWKLCVVLSYALIGMYVTHYLLSPDKDQMIYIYLLGGLIGGVMYWPSKHAVAVLGGMIGAIIAMVSLSNVGLRGISLLSVGGVALVCGTAYAFLNRRHVVIMVTAFIGAVLVVSGVTALILASPAWLDFFGDITRYRGIVIPFVLIVPTVVSCCYQLSEIKRLHVEM